MCCCTFHLDMASPLIWLASVSAAASHPQHTMAIMGEQWEIEGGREPGAVPCSHSQSCPSALCLLLGERFFSLFGICS